MELMYPVFIIIGLFLFVLAFLIPLGIKISKKKINIANLSYIKNNPVYIRLHNRYVIGIVCVFSFLFIAILSCGLLSSRIYETKTIDENIYNRDIILCMDVSLSTADLNKSLINSYKDVIKKLNGERFGISIFNTTSYLLVPLTDDYDYVTESLDDLYNVIDKVQYYYDHWYSYYDPNDPVFNDIQNTPEYKALFSGTLIGNMERGSSLIGDGLASCVYDFPSLDEEERARIIIFSTDNELNSFYDPDTGRYVKATPYVDLIKAAKISKKKKITVYSLAPDTVLSVNEKELKEATEITNGAYYVYSKYNDNIKHVVTEIEKHEKSLLEGDKVRVTNDFPEIPFIVLALSFGAVLIVEKVVLK